MTNWGAFRHINKTLKSASLFRVWSTDGRFDADVNALDPGFPDRSPGQALAGVTLCVNWVRLGLVFHQLSAFSYEQLVIRKGVTAISGVLKMGLFGAKSFRGKAPFSFKNVGM